MNLTKRVNVHSNRPFLEADHTNPSLIPRLPSHTPGYPVTPQATVSFSGHPGHAVLVSDYLVPGLILRPYPSLWLPWLPPWSPSQATLFSVWSYPKLLYPYCQVASFPGSSGNEAILSGSTPVVYGYKCWSFHTILHFFPDEDWSI